MAGECGSGRSWLSTEAVRGLHWVVRCGRSVTSPERLYVVTASALDGQPCQTITAVRYGASWPSGVLWNVSTCGNDSGGVAEANVMLFHFSGGQLDADREVVLLVEPYSATTGSRWTALDGSSGHILHQRVNNPLIGSQVWQLGDASNAEFVVWSKDGQFEVLYAYSIDSDGVWHLQLDPPLRWDSNKLNWLVNTNGELPGIIPPVIVLSAADGDGSNWLGYDVRTGQQVWTFDCRLCAASSIRAAYPTFDHYGWGSTMSAVNSSWALLITSFAWNSTSSSTSRSRTDADSDSRGAEALASCAFATQYGLFDAVKGHLVVQSAIGALQWTETEPEASAQFEVIDDSVLIAEARGLAGSVTWRALRASSLEQLGSGVLPSVVDSLDGGQHLFLGVDKHNATVMYVRNQDINVHNPVSAVTVRVDMEAGLVGEAEVSTPWRHAQHRSSARPRSDNDNSVAPLHTPTDGPTRGMTGHKPSSAATD